MVTVLPPLRTIFVPVVLLMVTASVIFSVDSRSITYSVAVSLNTLLSKVTSCASAVRLARSIASRRVILLL